MKRSNRNREEERLHSANSSSANSRLFSKKVGDSTSFPVTIDENEVYPMEYEQPVVHSHHRAIATRVSKPIAALESDDEEPVVEVMPVKYVPELAIIEYIFKVLRFIILIASVL